MLRPEKIYSFLRMEYLEAINELPRFKYQDSIFLAGGITGCGDWQKEVVEALSDLDVTIINPRRKDFDTSKLEESEKQIKWEHYYLRRVTDVAFWFPSETVCPITLLELGATLERWELDSFEPFGVPQEIYIGYHPDYSRKFDIRIQSTCAGYGWQMNTSLEDLVGDIKFRIGIRQIKRKIDNRQKGTIREA